MGVFGLTFYFLHLLHGCLSEVLYWVGIAALSVSAGPAVS